MIMSKIKKGVILVAGMGTRFLPATKAQPKEMLPIVDKPVVQYIVEEMVESGIEEIIFVTSGSKRAIEDHFDKNFELEYHLEKQGKEKLLKEVRDISKKVKVSYTRQSEPLGNGHALLCAKPLLQNGGPFVFSDGDSVIVSDEKPLTRQIIEVFEKYNKPVVAVHKIKKEDSVKYGIVDVDKVQDRIFKLKGIVEKPDPKVAPSDLAILGMRYVLTQDIFDYLEAQNPGVGGEIWFSDAFSELAKKKEALAYQYDGKYYDTGNKLEYMKTVVEFGLKHKEIKGEFKKYLKELTSRI